MIPKLLNADWNYWPEGHSAEAIWTSSARLGFDGIELGVYDVKDQLSDAKVTEYVRLTDEHGLAVGTVLYSMPPSKWPAGGLGNPAHAPAAIKGALDTAKVGGDVVELFVEEGDTVEAGAALAPKTKVRGTISRAGSALRRS